MIIGVISAVDNNNGVTVLIDGEDAASTKKYSYLSSYTPAANDKVLIEEINGSYVIMGKICTNITESGNARHADSADTATNAVNAQNATNAVNAANATNALRAETAGRAYSCTTADNCGVANYAYSCTGTAASANSSDRCKGNAASATTARGLDDRYFGTVYGGIVTSVSKDYSTGYVTDVSVSLGHNFVYDGV